MSKIFLCFTIDYTQMPSKTNSTIKFDHFSPTPSKTFVSQMCTSMLRASVYAPLRHTHTHTHTHTHLCTDSLSFTPTHYHCQLSKLQKASGRMYWTQASPGLLCFTLLSPDTICLCHCKVTKASIPKCSSEVGTCLQTAS